jgi:serine protease Do
MYQNDIYSSEDKGVDTSGYNSFYTDISAIRAVNPVEVNRQNGYNSYGNARNNVRSEKKGSFAHRAVLCVCLGLLFGLFAGIGFYGIGQTAGLMNGGGDNVGGGNEAVISHDVNMGGNVGPAESESGIKLTDSGGIKVVSSDVTEVVDEVMPAMVSIINRSTQTGMTFYGQQFERESEASGSGIIVAESDSELLIATNSHVVSGASRLEVVFNDGQVAEAQVKGMDADMDLAVIAIPISSLSEGTRNVISIATMGDSNELKLGEPVIAIGNALGYGQSVTNGIVSALNREVAFSDGSAGTYIQTNAAINFGNSGGALLNVNGEVIGINSAKIGGDAVEGMGYAIPISVAKPIISELMLKETQRKITDGNVGYLGVVSPQPVTEQVTEWYNMPQGLYITQLDEEGPAKAAGMRQGDILVSLDGTKLTTFQELQELLQYYSPGTIVTVSVRRFIEGEYRTVDLTVTLGKRPDR